MSRTAVLTALAFAATFAAPLAAQTPNMTGKWELTYETQRGPTVMTLVLEQAGETLKGTVEMPGRGGGAPTPVAISNGTIKGNEFSFAIVRTFGERTMEQTFKGKVSGDAAEGTMAGMGRGGAGQEIAFKAKRIPPG